MQLSTRWSLCRANPNTIFEANLLSIVLMLFKSMLLGVWYSLVCLVSAELEHVSIVQRAVAGNVTQTDKPLTKDPAPPIHQNSSSKLNPANDQYVYQTALNQRIYITGAGFTNATKLQLFPTVQGRVDHDVQVMASDRIELTLKTHRAWRTEPGPLMAQLILSFVDESAGKQQIAYVLADPYITPSAVALQATQSLQLQISGIGLVNLRNSSHFQIELLPTPESAYRVVSVGNDSVVVELVKGGTWLHPAQKLAQNEQIGLYVASIDTGAGRVIYDEPVRVGCIVNDGENGAGESEPADGLTTSNLRVS